MAKTPRKPAPVKKKHVETMAPPEEEAGESREPVLKRVKKVKREQVTPPPTEKMRVAMPTDIAMSLETSIALKTTSKFCGQWFHLIRGKAVTATASQIAYLRSCDLVE